MKRIIMLLDGSTVQEIIDLLSAMEYHVDDAYYELISASRRMQEQLANKLNIPEE